MQLVEKLAGGDLNDVQECARSKTYWREIQPRAMGKLLVRCLSVPIALASIAAALLEGGLSLAFYGVTQLLGKVRPLRGAYQFFSRAYDRMLDRLGREVLRDHRDTPALRLMVSLTLTAVPIFVMQ